MPLAHCAARLFMMVTCCAAFAGCSAPVRVCQVQSDCFAAEECVDGACVEAVQIDTPDASDDADGATSQACRAVGGCGFLVCNVSTGNCEACQKDTQCDENEVCDVGSGMCVCRPGAHACGDVCALDDSPETCGERCDPCDAPGGAQATCEAGACGFACVDGLLECGTSCPVDTACVQCLSDEDCGDQAASNCLPDGTCGECVDNMDCAHFTDERLCDGGRCVQCTTNSRTACGDNSCDARTNTCTQTRVRSADWCERCVADEECPVEHRCVAMRFAGADLPDGYCLPEEIGSCTVPLPIRVERPSLSGAPNDWYCTIREDITTCDAVADYGKTCDQDSDCGANELDDAVCRSLSGIRKCTYPCVEHDECGGGAFCITYCAPMQ